MEKSFTVNDGVPVNLIGATILITVEVYFNIRKNIVPHLPFLQQWMAFLNLSFLGHSVRDTKAAKCEYHYDTHTKYI